MKRIFGVKFLIINFDIENIFTKNHVHHIIEKAQAPLHWKKPQQKCFYELTSRKQNNTRLTDFVLCYI